MATEDSTQIALPRPAGAEHPWITNVESPLFVTTWPEATSTEDIEGYWDVVAPWMASLHSPWATVMDFSRFDASTSTAQQRRVFAERARGSLLDVQRSCVGIAVVVPNTLVRGVVTAVTWLVSPPAPTSFEATLEDAKAWIRERLREAAEPSAPPP